MRHSIARHTQREAFRRIIYQMSGKLLRKQIFHKRVNEANEVNAGYDSDDSNDCNDNNSVQMYWFSLTLFI